jgi:hypothetical protein
MFIDFLAILVQNFLMDGEIVSGSNHQAEATGASTLDPVNYTRLLERPGDPVNESVVRHVLEGSDSGGAVSLELPSKYLDKLSTKVALFTATAGCLAARAVIDGPTGVLDSLTGLANVNVDVPSKIESGIASAVFFGLVYGGVIKVVYDRVQRTQNQEAQAQQDRARFYKTASEGRVSIPPDANQTAIIAVFETHNSEREGYVSPVHVRAVRDALGGGQNIRLFATYVDSDAKDISHNPLGISEPWHHISAIGGRDEKTITKDGVTTSELSVDLENLLINEYPRVLLASRGGSRPTFAEMDNQLEFKGRANESLDIVEIINNDLEYAGPIAIIGDAESHTSGSEFDDEDPHGVSLHDIVEKFNAIRRKKGWIEIEIIDPTRLVLDYIASHHPQVRTVSIFAPTQDRTRMHRRATMKWQAIMEREPDAFKFEFVDKSEQASKVRDTHLTIATRGISPFTLGVEAEQDRPETDSTLLFKLNDKDPTFDFIESDDLVGAAVREWERRN